MPAVSFEDASTLFAAAMVASRLVPAGMVWVMLTVFCPELSNRFVLSSGESIIVPANTANASDEGDDLVVQGPLQRRQVRSSAGA